MADSIVRKKSFEFSIQIINLYKWIALNKMEYVLSKQLLRCGTSIGAIIREALNGQSKADFIHKLSISQKECDETIYWLELLVATNYISIEQYNTASKEASSILKMIKSIILTTKSSMIVKKT